MSTVYIPLKEKFIEFADIKISELSFIKIEYDVRVKGLLNILKQTGYVNNKEHNRFWIINYCEAVS